MRKLIAMVMAVAAIAAQGVNIYWANAGGGDICAEGNWNPEQVPEEGDNAYFQMAMTATLTASADFAADSFNMDTSPQTVTLDASGKTISTGNAWFDSVDVRLVNGTFDAAGEIGVGSSRGPQEGILTVEDGGVLKTGYFRPRANSVVNVLGGGTVETSNLYIGLYSGDTFCRMLIAGSGATVKLVGNTVHDIAVSHQAEGNNALEVRDGAVLEGATWNRTVGLSLNSYDNTVFVHSDALVTNVELMVGAWGSGNLLTVSNATFQCTGVSLNGLTGGESSANGIVVVDGGKLIAGGNGWGYGQNVTTSGQHERINGEDNFIVVSGTGSVFQTRGIHLGEGSWRHSLAIKDGAELAMVSGGMSIGGPQYAGTRHAFTVDGATASVGWVTVTGVSNTVRVARGGVLTMDGYGTRMGPYNFCTERIYDNGWHDTVVQGELGFNHFIVEPGCVVTNRGSLGLSNAGDTLVIDNAKYYLGQNGNRIEEGAMVVISGSNSVLHSTYESRIEGGGIIDITVGRHGFVETPIFLGRQYISGPTLHVHADEWAKKTGGEQTLFTVTNDGSCLETLRDYAVLDSPGVYWLKVVHEPETWKDEWGRDCWTSHLVLCAPFPPKGTTVLVR